MVLDYKEFTNPPTQEQNVREELARVEDLLSSEEASIQEPDSAAAPSSQVLDYEEFTNPPTLEQNVGEELAWVEDLLSSEDASRPVSKNQTRLLCLHRCSSLLPCIVKDVI